MNMHIKQQLPEEGDFVLCTVTNVQYNMVFVKLDEYNKDAVIHISEISPGRIRNIRDYVKEGKKVVCKILRIRTDTGHIDVSLRRVTEVQRRKKLNEIRLEQRSEKLIEGLAKELKQPIDVFLKNIRAKIFQHYPNFSTCFEDVVAGTVNLIEVGIDKNISEKLTELIMTKIKAPEVQIEGLISIKTYDPAGVELVKTALIKAEGEKITVAYSGSGDYRIIVRSEDYKTAEERLKQKVDAVIKYVTDHDGVAKFTRKED